MNIYNIFILIFLLSAFAVGTSFQDNDMIILEESLDNASIIIQNITFESSEDHFTSGVLIITEKFMHFTGICFIELIRFGYLFGNDNPEYFEAEKIFSIVKLLIKLAIISLLIKPLFYLIVCIVMFFIWIKDILDKKRKSMEKLK